MSGRADLRTYDVEEANAALPRVRPLVERIAAASARMPDLDDHVKVARYRAQRAEATRAERYDLEGREADLQQAEAELASGMIALEEMGVHLKDAREGLVDFLAYRDGELVELCWKLGEESVGHWHRIGEGFAGRKPI